MWIIYVRQLVYTNVLKLDYLCMYVRQLVYTNVDYLCKTIGLHFIISA